MRLDKQIFFYKMYQPPEMYLPVDTFRSELFFVTGPPGDLQIAGRSRIHTIPLNQCRNSKTHHSEGGIDRAKLCSVMIH